MYWSVTIDSGNEVAPRGGGGGAIVPRAGWGGGAWEVGQGEGRPPPRGGGKRGGTLY